MSWEEMYDFVENNERKNLEEGSEENSTLDSGSFEAIKKNELHEIVAKPTTFPYYNMVSWIISHAHVYTYLVMNHSDNIITYWKPEVLQSIYKLNPPELFLNKDYLANFYKNVLKKNEIDLVGCFNKWVDDSNNFKARATKLYPITHFTNPYTFFIKILSRIYREPNAENLKLEWVPLVHGIMMDSKNFNWADILS